MENSNTHTVLQKITCPNCKAANTWKEENPYRPFCSERCKNIDFGGWANEEYKIEGEEGEIEKELLKDSTKN